MCSASAHTAPRPLRGVQSLEKGGATASATIALEAETARHSPRLPCRRLASKAQQKQWRLFRGWGERGEGNTPFCEKTQDSKKLESIRENTTLRNLESTESNAEILKDAQLSESSHLDSETITESKEILRSEQRQNLNNAEFGESKADSESKTFTESKVEILKSVELKEVLKNEPIQNLSPKEPAQCNTEPKPNTIHTIPPQIHKHKIKPPNKADSKTQRQSQNLNKENLRSLESKGGRS